MRGRFLNVLGIYLLFFIVCSSLFICCSSPLFHLTLIFLLVFVSLFETSNFLWLTFFYKYSIRYICWKWMYVILQQFINFLNSYFSETVVPAHVVIFILSNLFLSSFQWANWMISSVSLNFNFILCRILCFFTSV